MEVKRRYLAARSFEWTSALKLHAFREVFLPSAIEPVEERRCSCRLAGLSRACFKIVQSAPSLYLKHTLVGPRDP